MKREDQIEVVSLLVEGVEELGEFQDGWYEVVGKGNKLLDFLINKPQSTWISVEDRLPNHNQKVLCYRPDSDIHEEDISIVMFGSVAGGFPSAVTHWQPLPKPPTK